MEEKRLPKGCGKGGATAYAAFPARFKEKKDGGGARKANKFPPVKTGQRGGIVPSLGPDGGLFF